MTLIKDLISIPTHVDAGAFVLRLTEGVQHAQSTLGTYVITKSLVLVEYAKGVEIRFKNLPEVWNLLGDQEEFAAYVTDELRLFLNPDQESNSAESEPG